MSKNKTESSSLARIPAVVNTLKVFQRKQALAASENLIRQY